MIFTVFMIYMYILQESTSTTMSCNPEQTVCGEIQQLVFTGLGSKYDPRNVTEEVMSVGSTQTGICNVRITCDFPQTPPLEGGVFLGRFYDLPRVDYSW